MKNLSLVLAFMGLFALPAHAEIIQYSPVNPATGAVTTWSGGTTGLTPATPTSGAIVLGGNLAVANGGTGLSTVGTNGQVLQSNGSAIVWGSGSYTLPTASTTTLGGVKVDGTTVTIGTTGVISSSGTPGGTSGQIQYNNGGSFGGLATVPVANGGTGGNGTIDARTTTSETFTLADAGNFVTMSNGSSSTLTVPQNSAVAFPISTVLCAQQIGVGSVTLTRDTNVTFTDTCSAPTAPVFSAQYATICAIQTAVNTWNVVGKCQ